MAPAHDPNITTTAPTITVRFFAGAAEAAGTEEFVVPAVAIQPVGPSAGPPSGSPDLAGGPAADSAEHPAGNPAGNPPGQKQGEPLEELLRRLPGALSSSGLTPDDTELARVCRACSFLINGQRIRRDDAVVRPGDQLDVLPPFAGG